MRPIAGFLLLPEGEKGHLSPPAELGEAIYFAMGTPQSGNSRPVAFTETRVSGSRSDDSSGKRGMWMEMGYYAMQQQPRTTNAKPRLYGADAPFFRPVCCCCCALEPGRRHMLTRLSYTHRAFTGQVVQPKDPVRRWKSRSVNALADDVTILVTGPCLAFRPLVAQGGLAPLRFGLFMQVTISQTVASVPLTTRRLVPGQPASHPTHNIRAVPRTL